MNTHVLVSILAIAALLSGCNRTPSEIAKPNSDPESNHSTRLTEAQVLRLFEGEWYPNLVESAKYNLNAHSFSELSAYFDANITPFSETHVVFFDDGISWTKKAEITSKPKVTRVKLNQGGPIDWNWHVAMISENRIALREGGFWLVCDHWSTRK